MKFNRKIISLLLALTIALPPFFTVATTTEKDVVVSVQINNPVMQVNGESEEIDEGRGTSPIIDGGRTLLPIRAVIEAFDGIVGWENSTRTAILTMNDDVIKLVIDSKIAYLNDEAYTLDVAPKIVNGRTMLPIRFVAEGFNLGVAWNGSTRTVTIIRNTFEDYEYNRLMSALPAYNGSPYTVINNNVPYFKSYEIISASFEYYSTLDELGRCDVCMASIAKDIMPTENRESISSVKPTGWINAAYDFIDGKYLYNRCHLIGFQLTGENANERNLITGTRYLNVDGMLPFENKIDDYVEETGNHVMYRVTPVFRGNNLVADGVLLEAYSVEDNGKGISFCVYCYNVQPNVNINYATGASAKAGTTPATTAQKVYRTPSGKKYHFDAECGGKNSYEISLIDAQNAKLTPCEKCAA